MTFWDRVRERFEFDRDRDDRERWEGRDRWSGERDWGRMNAAPHDENRDGDRGGYGYGSDFDRGSRFGYGSGNRGSNFGSGDYGRARDEDDGSAYRSGGGVGNDVRGGHWGAGSGGWVDDRRAWNRFSANDSDRGRNAGDPAARDEERDRHRS